MRNIVAVVCALALICGGTIAYGSSQLLVCSPDDCTLKLFDAETGAFIKDFATGPSFKPTDVVLGPDGQTVYVAFGNGTIDRYNARTGSFIGSLESGNTDGIFNIAFGPDGYLYASSFWEDRVLRIDPTSGSSLGDFVQSGSGGLDGSMGLVIRENRLLVSSRISGQILSYDSATGAAMGVFATTFGNGPQGLAFGPHDGNLYVVNDTEGVVQRFDGVTGTYIDNFARISGLSDCADLAFGPDGNLYVSCPWSNDVQRFDGATGEFLGSIGSDVLRWPVGLTFVPEVVPEPSSIATLLCGVCGIGSVLWKRRSA